MARESATDICILVETLKLGWDPEAGSFIVNKGKASGMPWLVAVVLKAYNKWATGKQGLLCDQLEMHVWLPGWFWDEEGTKLGNLSVINQVLSVSEWTLFKLLFSFDYLQRWQSGFLQVLEPTVFWGYLL